MIAYPTTAWITIYETRDKADGPTVKIHGYDQPLSKLIAFDGDRFVYAKVPGHKYSTTNHPGMDGYSYAPVRNEVWEIIEERSRETKPAYNIITGKAIRRLQW